MCGRYYIDKINRVGVEILVQEVDKNLIWPSTGDIRPSEIAVIVSGNDGLLRAQNMRWGFPGFDGKSLLINARSESASEKVTFAESVRNRRCIIAASGFYEWNKAKEKVAFELPEKQPIYMAGLWKNFGGEDRFVIITTTANESMIPVHDRMPLILDEKDLRSWILDNTKTSEFLSKEGPQLVKYQEFEQMTFGI